MRTGSFFSGAKNLSIIFVDDHILAVAKPSGLAVIPQRYDNQKEDLRTILQHACGKLFVVHRIDKDTSGAVLFARSAYAHRELNMQFTLRTVEKRYHAIVSPCPHWEEMTADIPLRTCAGQNHLTVVDRQAGKEAVTRFRVLERLGRFALVEAQPVTGRTHQIRVHCAALSIPVAADNLYGDGKPILLSQLKRKYKGDTHGERPLIGRLGLHAYSFTFKHPVLGGEMTVTAEYPRDFRATIKQLRKLAGNSHP